MNQVTKRGTERIRSFNIKKVCNTCGKEFLAYSDNQLYCSKECYNKCDSKVKTATDFRLKRKLMVDTIKMEKGCCICGYKEHPAALQFDHIDPSTKSFTISQDKKKAWNSILEEIDKCRILCANCHSVETFNNKHYTIRK